MYTVMPIVVTIISAIMRIKWDRFNNIGDVFRCILFGILWPLTIVVGIVCLASDFLCWKINAKRGN